MLRDNLRAAIQKSDMVVKEIASKSGVNKRTIDKWVGPGDIVPKVNDLYSVCKVLSTTMEWLVDGESGAEYLREIVRNDPMAIQVPLRILPIVEGLLLLDNRELKAIRAFVEEMTKDRKKTSTHFTGNG